MTDPSNLIVQGFWHGSPLTTMERLSMRSFLAQGYPFHLFSYEEVKGAPDGVILCDAREIMSESVADTFRCAQQLSDAFRISLLYKKGGIYSDLDNVLIKSLEFSDEPYMFYRDYDESTISFALSKAPAGSPIMAHCHQFLSDMSEEERSRLSWQEIGSEFACGAVEFFKLTNFAKPGRTFDPVHWTRAKELVNPAAKFDLSSSHSVHLFHAVWNDGPKDRYGKGWDLGQPSRERIDTDGNYHPDCLYERLKRKIFDGDNSVVL